jgi:eukaryotic-like serine/threonine-protein kinase
MDRLGRPHRRYLLTALKISILGAALAVVAAVSAYVTVRRAVSGRDVLVPNVTQMSAAEAGAVLRKQGLLLETVAERNDPHTEAGRVLAQEPPAGASIKMDRKVKVILSLGDKGGSIPDLRGSAARSAQISLQQQGLKVGGQVYAYSPKDPENLVIAQDPLAGELGHAEGKVGLLVSRGRRPLVYVMPDLTGRPQEEVIRFLTRAGLRPGPVRREPVESGGTSGTVVGQRPEAGYPVRAGDLVTLTVAGGSGGADDE